VGPLLRDVVELMTPLAGQASVDLVLEILGDGEVAGDGIALGDRRAIFDPFVRVRSANTHGAGLGLAIASRILEAHRGSIGVESEVGAGSSFCFTLPLRSE